MLCNLTELKSADSRPHSSLLSFCLHSLRSDGWPGPFKGTLPLLVKRGASFVPLLPTYAQAKEEIKNRLHSLVMCFMVKTLK